MTTITADVTLLWPLSSSMMISRGQGIKPDVSYTSCRVDTSSRTPTQMEWYRVACSAASGIQHGAGVVPPIPGVHGVMRRSITTCRLSHVIPAHTVPCQADACILVYPGTACTTQERLGLYLSMSSAHHTYTYVYMDSRAVAWLLGYRTALFGYDGVSWWIYKLHTGKASVHLKHITLRNGIDI